MTPKQQANIVKLLVEQEINKREQEWRRNTAQQMYAVVLKNLHDKHDFTPGMLVNFFDQCTADFDAIGDKYVKIEDFYALLGEMGVKVK